MLLRKLDKTLLPCRARHKGLPLLCEASQSKKAREALRENLILRRHQRQNRSGDTGKRSVSGGFVETFKKPLHGVTPVMGSIPVVILGIRLRLPLIQRPPDKEVHHRKQDGESEPEPHHTHVSVRICCASRRARAPTCVAHRLNSISFAAAAY